MATSLRYPKGHAFFDNNGALLASGTLTYYRAGTTTLLNIYSDAAGTTTLPNPLTLNSAGRAVDGSSVATAIYLKDQGYDYKELIKNSAGTTLYTDDNIAEPVDPGASLSDFAKPTTEWSTDTSATVTLVVGDFGKGRLASSGSNSITYALPAASTVSNGRPITIKKTNASNTVTVDADGTDTIDGAATFAWTEDDRAYKFTSDGANWQVELSYLAEINYGDLTAAVIDEDTMVSNSATRVPSQQSVKAYVDTRLGIVASGAVSAAATINIALGAADLYEIDLINFLPDTDSVSLNMRFSQSAVFLSGASDYEWGIHTYDARVTDAADTKITIATPAWGNAAGETGTITVRIFRPSATAFRKAANWQGYFHSTSGEPIATHGGGALIANTNAIDGVQFLFTSGNIASGYYAVRSYSFT
jgi:hypothetical protein